jgi:20S proteasome alpha/beta subunit
MKMTTCNAVVCDDGKTIIMVADKLIGVGYVQSELKITKMRPIHKEWWMLFAGDDLTPVFDIVDYAKAGLDQSSPMSVGEVQEAVKVAFARKRMENAEALYLTPIGWDVSRFNAEGNALLPDFTHIKTKIEDYSLPIELLVAGFDAGSGHIFTLYGSGETRGVPHRADIPGFASIGSGAIASMYMMYYRDLDSKTPAREAMFYALEGKYFAEQASGVGESTDLFIAQRGKELIQVSDEHIIEEKLIPICYRLSPNRIQKRDRDVLNGIKELSEFPKLSSPKKRRRPKSKLKTKGESQKSPENSTVK